MTTDDMDTDVQDVNNAEDSGTSESRKQALSMNEILDDKGVPLTNRFAEMSRKLNKVSDLESKLDQILNATQQTAQQAAGAAYSDLDEFEGMSAKEIAKVIDQKLADRERVQLQTKHLNDFESLKKQYPELDKNSPDYDPEFYNLANNAYLNFGLDGKAEGAMEAVEYAAYKSGKTKQSMQREVLSDEARRSRKLAEGATGSRKAKPDEDFEDQLATARKHMRINPKYFKKAKANLGQKG